ncbi:MAG TPA: P1 family peptidase [Acidimicrobiales bacterium]|jgi:L-aminopeptidase/D-esterase-like protein|nr:P1 family peptidase [Acidimicrobiales bacterium]
MITDVAGVRVGHWTDSEARTGCTVVLFPDGTVASGDVRGGAPATRELELLDPRRTVSRIDAAVLTGGSAFGLAAADGAMRFCEERGMGFATPVGPVPIVVALALFDLAVGDPAARPGPDEGYAACVAAIDGPVELGLIGAGAGATVAKLGLPRDRRPGGLVSAAAEGGGLRVAALVAVNASGTPGADDRMALDLAGAHDVAEARVTGTGFVNTTIGVVATNARLDKMACHLVAQGGHDGLARSLFPAHTRGDGDAFVAAATGEVDADVDVVRALTVHVVAEAVRSLAD